MAVIFISHSSDDEELIKKIGIFEALKQAGFENIFLDFDEEKGIKLGEKWEEKIKKEIKKSHIVILLLSPNWIKSKWCFAEFKIAQTLGKTILPVIIDNTNNKIYNWINENLKEQADITTDKNTLKKLINRLKEIEIEKQRGYPLKGVYSPYPGLISFDIKDAAIFFGREKKVKEIIEKLNNSIFYSEKQSYHIIAASGLGKSSLLKAGVLAYLIYHQKEDWSILPVITPSDSPISSLSMAFAKYFDDINLYDSLKKKLLSDDYKNTISMIQDKLWIKSKNKILLPIDQLEELFSPQISENEREQFIKIITYFSKKRGFYIITTLRADFLTLFQKNKDFSIIFENSISDTSLQPLSEQGIIDAIKKPAELFGIEVTDGLVDRLRKDMGDNYNLPLLAFTLERLYHKLNPNQKIMDEKLYESLAEKSKNPMKELLNEEAEKAFKKASEILKEEEIKKLFLNKLINISLDEKITKKPLSLKALSKNEENALEFFVKKRLLIKNENTISIIHESFIEWWERLQKWIQQNKEVLIIKKKIEYEYKNWIKHNKNKKYLLSGANLDTAIKALKSNSDIFLDEEKEFIKKSKRYDFLKKTILYTSITSTIIAGFSTAFIYKTMQEKTQEALNKITLQKKQISNLNVQIIKNNNQLIKKQILLDYTINKIRQFIKNLIINHNIDKTIETLLNNQVIKPNLSKKIYQNYKNLILEDKVSFVLSLLNIDTITSSIFSNYLPYYILFTKLFKFQQINILSNANSIFLNKLQNNIKDLNFADKLSILSFINYKLNNYKQSLNFLNKKKINLYDNTDWNIYLQDILKLNNENLFNEYLQKLKVFLKTHNCDDLKKFRAIIYKENKKFYEKFLLWNIKTCKQKISSNKLAVLYGSMSWVEILLHKYKEALKNSQKAIKLSNELWLKTNLAHSLLLTGNYNKAKEIYLKYKGKKAYNDSNITWEQVILNDFKEMEKYGIKSDKIEKIKKLLQKKDKNGI